jgi:dipeptidase E
VKGLGLIKGIHCPHYNGSTGRVPRRSRFREMIRKIGGLGIAVDNRCAIEFVDDSYRVLRSHPRANAYRVYRRRGEVISEQIRVQKQFTATKLLAQVS